MSDAERIDKLEKRIAELEAQILRHRLGPQEVRQLGYWIERPTYSERCGIPLP